MILTPCPVCGRESKSYDWKTGYSISCVGDRHTLAVGASDGEHHAVSFYRGSSREEVERAWNKAFGKDAAQ